MLAIPGVAFMPQEDKTGYIRVSYSAVTKEQMDEALTRLASVVDEAAAEVNNTN